MLRDPLRDTDSGTDPPVDPLERAARELRLIVTIAPDAVNELCASLTRLSDGLNDAARVVGLEQPGSRGLLALRTRIDSFVLAARTLDDAQPGSARVVALLRRAVDQTLTELAALAAVGAAGAEPATATVRR